MKHAAVLTLEPGSLGSAFRLMGKRYGPQHWWPGDSPFEIMVGAILTQNTAWSNVERAIGNLREAGMLEPRAMLDAPLETLAERIRPAGYFNVKAARLRNFCLALDAAGGEGGLAAQSTDGLRRWLLAINGIGPETADDILLYAFERPVFVVDAYTRRIGRRLGWLRGDEPYEQIRRGFEAALGPDAGLYNEYHALLVHHGKQLCAKRPRCDSCCLARTCPAAAAR